ncbi:GroES-like protein [Annulohypoxylon bovei var. microspora]|nr:GroES-like protein [Annulohypoxylon bovei var. microspora]
MATTSSELPPIPTHMKAVQVTAFNESYKLNIVPVPTSLGLHELLVKVAVASYCHTDGMVAAGVFGTKLPATASHEGAGTVVRVGEGVSGFKVGERVMCGIPLGPCGMCGDCASASEGEGGHGQYCAHTKGHVGVHIDGCFAEYVRVDERFTTRLPSEISFTEAAPLACAGRTVWRGVQVAGVKKGEWLLILGSGGGLGHLGVQFAKGLGVNVIGVDARDEGLKISAGMGADVVLDARKAKGEVVAEVQKATGGQGVHAAIVLADAPSATALAAAATRMHGTVVQIAQPQNVAELVFRDVRLRGSLLCSPAESRDMVRFIAGQKIKEREEGEGGIRVETTTFEGLEKIDEVLELVGDGRIRGKAVVVVDRGQVEEDRRRGWE